MATRPPGIHSAASVHQVAVPEGLMITVYARLFATLRRLYPDLGLGEALPVTLPDGSTIGDLIRELDLPEGEVKIVFVNGLVRTPDDPLVDGDEIGIFPPVGGG